MPATLHLHEELTLLALKDEKGTIASGANHLFAVGGAILAELLLEGRAVVDVEKKKRFLRLVDPKPFGDPVIDECIEKVRTAKKRAQLQSWVHKFAHVKKLKEKVAIGLCRKGILRADEDKVLLLFTRKIYPELDPKPEREIMKRLEDAIFRDSKDLSARTTVLVSLAQATNILPVNFDKKELKRRKQRIEQIMEGNLAGDATQAAIEAIQAAVLVAVMIPTIVTTTSS